MATRKPNLPSPRSRPPSASSHQPFVPDEAALPEFTWPAVAMGALLGIVFGASSLYLVLKVGMTVSASNAQKGTGRSGRPTRRAWAC